MLKMFHLKQIETILAEIRAVRDQRSHFLIYHTNIYVVLFNRFSLKTFLSVQRREDDAHIDFQN